MSIWVYILIGIVIVIFVLPRLMRKAAGMPVLKVRVGTPDGFKYGVSFDNVHSEAQEIEHVRMVLNFTAKMLTIIGSRQKQASQVIFDFIEKVSETDLPPENARNLKPSGISIFDQADSGDFAQITSVKEIEGVLYYKNVTTRNILTKLPAAPFDLQYAHSVIALTIISAKYMDDFHWSYLKKSLKYMVDSFKNGVDPKNMRAMATLPNEAFLARGK